MSQLDVHTFCGPFSLSKHKGKGRVAPDTEISTGAAAALPLLLSGDNSRMPLIHKRAMLRTELSRLEGEGGR
eukprot:scaffold225429_cov17-Tisochrysis_lutea.AAC.2